jgi:hypothetical protein
MPTSTMRNQDEYPLPEDVAFPARLTAVSEKRNEFTYKAHHKPVKEGKKNVGDTGVISRWTWEFEIVDGDYSGLRAWGETEDALTNHPDNKVRQWAETLLGREFEIGEGLDTDDLIGLPCLITVRHDEPRPKKDGSGNFYPCPVADVFPADALSGGDEPPF